VEFLVPGADKAIRPLKRLALFWDGAVERPQERAGDAIKALALLSFSDGSS
jgi:hypothetical protein